VQVTEDGEAAVPSPITPFALPVPPRCLNVPAENDEFQAFAPSDPKPTTEKLFVS
jgi:hypothetical protein